MAPTEFDQYKEQLTKIFKGDGNITKTMLQDWLRLLGKPVSGNKSVLAKCLLAVTLATGEMTTPNDPPLAANYITDEQELDSVVDDEDDEDDGEGGEGTICNSPLL
jgi:uncharacterized membrane-anchored protein YhcB (DUF1043 family)